MIASVPEEPRELRALRSFGEELQANSDLSGRATVLIVSAFCEELLRLILEGFLIDAKPAKQLLGSGGQAALGTFSAKIQLAEALGLIAAWEAKALNVVRAIRNEYAHRLEFEISGTKFRDHTDNLAKIQLDVFGLETEKIMPDRQRFIFSLTMLFVSLSKRIENARQQRRSPAEELGS